MFPSPGSSRRDTLKEKRKPTVVLKKLSGAVTGAAGRAEEVAVSGSQNTIPMASGNEEDSDVVKTGPRIISDMCLLKEHRIRVVDGDIVNSPITAVETSDAPIAIDSSESLVNISTDSITSDMAAPRGKKRRRKPKGCNVPGAKSLSKMSTSRMEYEDAILDRPDFMQITKRDHKAGKRKKFQECPLDDSLSYKQKVAVEEVTYLFPQMSSKTIMTETLRVLDAVSTAQRKTSSMKSDLRRQIIVGVKIAR